MIRAQINYTPSRLPQNIASRIGSIFLVALAFLCDATTSLADSSSGKLAAYYDQKMLLCNETAYQWQRREKPRFVADSISQVGVGRDAGYVLTKGGQLLGWLDWSVSPHVIHDQITWFSAGRHGIFASDTDQSLLFFERPSSWFSEGDIAKPVKIAVGSTTASIGDGANYFITQASVLHVNGLAHRGQYGDGKLQSSPTFTAVANDVVSIKAHTGHAILLTKTGTVMGTGGNIYGPLGQHGIGDKAVSWGVIFNDAIAIATGSSHSLALKADGSLWSWGRDIGLVPKKVLGEVIAAAADREGSIALRSDNTIWQWDRGKQPMLHFRCP